MRLTPAEKRKFLMQNPKCQLITKTDLAKVRNTWDGLPHIVSKGAQTNFAQFAQTISDAWNERDGDLLFGDKYYQESVAMCLMFRYTEAMIPKQEWYQQGYRANIVTYTIALLHKLIQRQFEKQDLDLAGIWIRQVVPDAVRQILVGLSELVYDKLTDPSRGVENVTQWCKREGCWNNIQTMEYTLPPKILDCLIGQDEMRTSRRDAKKDQRIVSEADTMTKVVGIPAISWQNALTFATSRRLVSPEELTALRVAGQIPNKIPNAIQCKKLLAILERIQEEGFKL
jgi:hypothetical protein